MKELRKSKGYTVDLKLKQFRKVRNNNIEFIDFDKLRAGVKK